MTKEEQTEQEMADRADRVDREIEEQTNAALDKAYGPAI